MVTIMYHRPPFQEGEKLAQVNANVRIPSHVQYSPACIRFMQSMLQQDPDRRPTAEQIFAHASKLLGVDPEPPRAFEFRFEESDLTQARFQSIVRGELVDAGQFQHQPDEIRYSLYHPANMGANQIQGQKGQLQEEAKKVEVAEPLAVTMAKVIDFLVDDTDDGPFNESYFRGLVRLAHVHTDQKEATSGLLGTMDRTKHATSKVTAALKFVGICQKLLLYCPQVSTSESFSKVVIFGQLCSGWRDVLLKRLADPAKDRFRCEFFIKLITHWASNLQLQIGIATDFKEFVDCAHNVHGITENSEF